MGLTGVALDVGFRVRNPNPEPLRIERFEYELVRERQPARARLRVQGGRPRGLRRGQGAERFDVSLLSLPGAVKGVLREDRVHARAKGRFYATGSFGHKELPFDSDAEVQLGR